MKNFIEHSYLRSLSYEMSGADFDDERLRKRLGGIVDSIASNPALSFPKALGCESAREGFYRFLRNDKVTPERILEPHIEATCSRVIEERDVLVVHDTTQFKFKCEVEREGLGWLRHRKNKARGFFGHFALALSEKAPHLPLGILGLEAHFRYGRPKGKGDGAQRTKRRRSGISEALRWGKLVDRVKSKVGGKANLTHVMDREADCYELFCQLVSQNEHFIIRIAYDRNLNEQSKKLFDSFNGLPILFERKVPLSRRNVHKFEHTRRIHKERKNRVAKLAFSASRAQIRRPAVTSKDLPELQDLNIVRVYELDCPEGEPAVEWKLYTTRPIDTVEQVLRIVDNYRARWIIEEYFKALKTGCSYEKRQLESKRTLLNALATIIPVAWRLLSLRSLGRAYPTSSPRTALSETQIQVLRAIHKKKFNKLLPKDMNLEQAMLAIATLGGHIKNNGRPGWQVLGRGYQDLLQFELGWMAASEGKCDQ